MQMPASATRIGTPTFAGLSPSTSQPGRRPKPRAAGERTGALHPADAYPVSEGAQPGCVDPQTAPCGRRAGDCHQAGMELPRGGALKRRREQLALIESGSAAWNGGLEVRRGRRGRQVFSMPIGSDPAWR